MYSEVKNIVLESIKENFNKTENIETMVLMGSGSTLDSLDFVSLIVDIENKIMQHFEKSITITNDRAFSNKYNPFGNVDKLTSYIITLLEE